MKILPSARNLPARLVALSLGLAMLAGCASLEQAAGPQNEQASLRSGESLRLEQYYAAVQSRLLSQGLMRTDGGGPDAPFTPRTLAQDFQRIALFDEYTVRGNHFVAQATPSTLRRWNKPIRISILFDERIPKATREKDRKNVAAYAQRLSRLTGVPMRITDKNPNFHIMFLYRDRQRAIGPELQRRIPGIGSIVVNEIQNMPRSTYCVAYAFAEPDNGSAYDSALIIIRAEHPDLMRLSCIHEEMAQAMGLANDSPEARPSIFNDDEEFALLTRHDELLLRMLYDRRLKVGMTADQTRLIVPAIANELMKGSS